MDEREAIVQGFQAERDTDKGEHENIENFPFKQTFRSRFIIETVKVMI